MRSKISFATATFSKLFRRWRRAENMGCGVFSGIERGWTIGQNGIIRIKVPNRQIASRWRRLDRQRCRCLRRLPQKRQGRKEKLNRPRRGRRGKHRAELRLSRKRANLE